MTPFPESLLKDSATIVLAPGEYSLPRGFSIKNRGVTIIGSSAEIVSDGGSTVAIHIKADDVLIRGVTVACIGGTGIKVTQAKRVTIDDCTSGDCQTFVSADEADLKLDNCNQRYPLDGYGLYAARSTVKVAGCTFTPSIRESCIRLQDCQTDLIGCSVFGYSSGPQKAHSGVRAHGGSLNAVGNLISGVLTLGTFVGPQSGLEAYQKYQRTTVESDLRHFEDQWRSQMAERTTANVIDTILYGTLSLNSGLENTLIDGMRLRSWERGSGVSVDSAVEVGGLIRPAPRNVTLRRINWTGHVRPTVAWSSPSELLPIVAASPVDSKARLLSAVTSGVTVEP